MIRSFHVQLLCGCLFGCGVLAAADVPSATRTNAAPPQTEADAQKKAADLIKIFETEESITNSLGMVMVWLSPGYRAAQYEVTQAQYQQVMENNPSKFQNPQYPVDSITVEEASQLCKKLTEKEIAGAKLPKGYYYSLPSEAQWEFYVDEADLRQSITSYFGDRNNPESVGLHPPNNLGLYDTRGSVWDLCDSNVGRGGSWRSYEDYVFIQFRYVLTPGQRYEDIGFRLLLQGKAEVVPPKAPPKAQQPVAKSD
jgi:formylglycine-generating enzyme required for sulfatase activity